MEEQRMNMPAGGVPPKAYTPMHRHKRREVTMWIRAAIALVAVVIIAALVWWIIAMHNNTKSNGESSAVNTSEYQAVFLTNGQVYFGKLKVVNPTYLKLSNIYYLQVQSTSTSGTTSASQLSDTSNSKSGNNVQLVKLGNELQGPEDMMAINREQVLFWENLKPSGKVTQAINTYLKNQ